MINSIVFKDNTIAASVHSYTIGTDMRHIVHSSLYRWHNTSLAKIYKHFSHIINFNIIICTYQNCKTLNARCDHNFWPAVCVYKILNAHKNKNKNKIAFQKILKTTRWNSSYYDAELLYVYRYPYDERASYHKRTIIVRTKNFFFALHILNKNNHKVTATSSQSRIRTKKNRIFFYIDFFLHNHSVSKMQHPCKVMMILPVIQL